MSGGGGGVTGYTYYMGIHFGLCHALTPYSGATVDDGLLEIRAGNLTAWSGVQSSSATLFIDSPSLFGGSQKEGGLQGFFDLMMGDPDQTANTYLLSQQGAPQPAYRGVASIVYKSGQVGANNPYPKPWSFRVRRTTSGWAGGTPWYPAKAAITLSNGVVGQNPAHIVYEAITNADWGMGYPSSQIDLTSFAAAADQLFTEGFGLCVLWNRSNSIQDFLQQIMDYIAGVLISSPTTGLFQLILIRGGYDPSTLPVITVDNVDDLTEKEDSAISGCVNEMVVTYFDPTIKNKQSVIIQALGAITAQGVVVSTTKDYPGIATQDLAARLAQRELGAVSVPLKRIKFKTDRSAYQFVPGGLFVMNMNDAALNGVVFRIGEVDYGVITDGQISITAVQDQFSLPTDTYLAPQTSGWVPPSRNPVAASIYHGFTAGYRDLFRALGASNLAALPPGDAYLSLALARPDGLQYSYNIFTSPPPYSVFNDHGIDHFAPSATVLASLNPFDTSVTLQSITDGTLMNPGTAAVIIDGSGFEIVRVDTIDPSSGAATFGRGCVDTIPAPHPAGVRVFFIDGYLGSDNLVYTSGETIEVKPLTNAPNGQLPLASAPTISIALTARWELPYPVAELKVNGTRWDLVGSAIQAGLTLSWAQRNRVTQQDQLIDTTGGTVTPETGTTYTVTLYDGSNVQFAQFTGITGTSWSWSPRDPTHTSVISQVTTVTGAGSSTQSPKTGVVILTPPPPLFSSFHIAGSTTNLFIIVHVDTTGPVYTYADSPDCVTFTDRVVSDQTNFPLPDLTNLANISGTWYANQNGTAYFWKNTSADWFDTPWSVSHVTTLPTSGITGGFSFGIVRYLNGQWVTWTGAIGAINYSPIVTSPDYVTFTDKAVPTGIPSGSADSVGYTDILYDTTNSRYLIVGTRKTAGVLSVRFYTTPDLIAMTEVAGFNAAAPGTPGTIIAIAQNGAQLVAVGFTTISSVETPLILYSGDNGSTWASSTPTWPSSLTTNRLYGVLFDGTDFVAYGRQNFAHSSDGGATWTFADTGKPSDYKAVTNAAGVIMMQEVGPAGYGTIYCSSDHGVTWMSEFGPGNTALTDESGVNIETESSVDIFTE